MKSLDITTLDRLNLRNANPVGILAGRELQNGLGVEGSTTTSISSSTKNKVWRSYNPLNIYTSSNYFRCALLTEFSDWLCYLENQFSEDSVCNLLRNTRWKSREPQGIWVDEEWICPRMNKRWIHNWGRPQYLDGWIRNYKTSWCCYFPNIHRMYLAQINSVYLPYLAWELSNSHLHT